MKNQIKSTTVSYCKAKKRASRNERHKLTLQLIKAKQRLTDGDNSAFKEIKNLENELKILNLNELEGVKIRSRSQWIEDGEKPSRYFFSLERKRANDNHISSFFTKQNTEVTEKDDLISTATEFYQDLYSKLPTDKNMQAELINNLDAHLSPDNAALCDGLFTLNELYDAASKMAHSKTPGLDGFHVEFYLKFWGRKGKILIDVFNESFASGSLPHSQKLSLIRLIHKKQDRRLLKNWRPISLLNVDYKIAAKALANRLRTVLAEIVNDDQTCSVPGRSISDHLNLIRDLLVYIDKADECGILLNLDQEKAFDRVDCDFLQNVLIQFGFVDSFRRWIDVLYNGAHSKLIISGFLSPSINLEKGVHQGCPLSPLLYVLLSEVLGCSIRKCPGIDGFRLPGAGGLQFKVAQYADDTMLFLKDDLSLRHLMDLINQYELATGAWLNKEKSEAMWVGKWRFIRTDRPYHFKWVTKMKILGTFFSQQNVEKDNWQPKLEKVLDLWKSRDLSFVGRSLIINILGASLFWYLAKVFIVPKWVATSFDRLVWPFLWNGKTETVKRSVLYNPLSKGGLRMINVSTKCKSLLVLNLSSFLESS